MKPIGKFMASGLDVIEGKFDSMYIREQVLLPDINMYWITAISSIFSDVHDHMPVPEYRVWFSDGALHAERISGAY
jgi:hypothetical protein